MSFIGRVRRPAGHWNEAAEVNIDLQQHLLLNQALAAHRCSKYQIEIHLCSRYNIKSVLPEESQRFFCKFSLWISSYRALFQAKFVHQIGPPRCVTRAPGVPWRSCMSKAWWRPGKREFTGSNAAFYYRRAIPLLIPAHAYPDMNYFLISTSRVCFWYFRISSQPHDSNQAIGVTNYSLRHLKQLMKNCKIKPLGSRGRISSMPRFPLIKKCTYMIRYAGQSFPDHKYLPMVHSN